MKTFCISILSLLCTVAANAQDCSCPTGINNDNEGKPYRTFRFSNGTELGICGYATVERDDTTFTQFILFNCGDNSTIKEWGETKSSKISKSKDTLIVKDIFGLPIGQSFSTIRVPFYFHKFFFKNGELQEATAYNRSLQKYSKSQADQVISEYRSLSKENRGSMLRVSKMLFWAMVSGNKEAEAMLKSIPEKYGPFDGAIAQEMEDIIAMSNNWKEKNTR